MRRPQQLEMELDDPYPPSLTVREFRLARYQHPSLSTSCIRPVANRSHTSTSHKGVSLRACERAIVEFHQPITPPAAAALALPEQYCRARRHGGSTLDDRKTEERSVPGSAS